MSALNIHMLSHHSMSLVRLYSSHSVTTSRRLGRTTVWYLAIPSCLVVSVFNGVMPGWAFEQSIRGRPATFPDSARQWNSFAMWRSARSDSVSWSIGSISTRLAARIVAACYLYRGVRRRWRSRNGAVRTEFAKAGSVSAMAPFWTISRIFGNCLSSERCVMTLVSFKPESFFLLL